MPSRIQLRRNGGWRLPPGGVSVARPGRWGNPFAVYRAGATVIGRPWTATVEKPLNTGVWIYRAGDDVAYMTCSHVDLAIHHSVELFKTYCAVRLRDDPDAFSAWLEPLRGRDLGCWCPPGQRCHGDHLLELAN
jgi:hypothetical protein